MAFTRVTHIPRKFWPPRKYAIRWTENGWEWEELKPARQPKPARKSDKEKKP
jgi:hypothetical protein